MPEIISGDFKPDLDFSEPLGDQSPANKYGGVEQAVDIEAAYMLIELTEQLYCRMNQILPNSFKNGNFYSGMKIVSPKAVWQKPQQIGTDFHSRAWLKRCVNDQSDEISIFTDCAQLSGGQFSKIDGSEQQFLKLAGGHDTEWPAVDNRQLTTKERISYLLVANDQISQIEAAVAEAKLWDPKNPG